MDQGDPHYRLAITAFDDPHSLWGTIRALLAKGFAIEQFCLLASRTIMEQVGVLGGAISGNSPHLRMLTEHVEDWPTTGDRRAHDGHHIVATAGPLITSVLPVLGDGSADKARIPDDHRAELESHAREGAIVLIVKSSNPAQQWLSTRTFLEQSSHSVKTYEFAVRSSAGEARDG